MQSLSQPDYHFLLEVSMEDLHKDIAGWFSEIAFWKVELAFFQKLLDKVSGKTTSEAEKKKIDYFQNLILFYREEILDVYQHDIHSHELYLKDLLHNKQTVNDQFYRDSHQKFAGKLTAFQQNIQTFRQELYQFAEQYL